MQRLVVHPADHQHLAGVVLLDDGGDESVGVALEARREVGVEGGHAPSIPAGTNAADARGQRTDCWATQLACSRP